MRKIFEGKHSFLGAKSISSGDPTPPAPLLAQRQTSGQDENRTLQNLSPSPIFLGTNGGIFLGRPLRSQTPGSNTIRVPERPPLACLLFWLPWFGSQTWLFNCLQSFASRGCGAESQGLVRVVSHGHHDQQVLLLWVGLPVGPLTPVSGIAERSPPQTGLCYAGVSLPVGLVGPHLWSPKPLEFTDSGLVFRLDPRPRSLGPLSGPRFQLAFDTDREAP